MWSTGLVQKVGRLSDLELALLLCFVAKEHCLIETDGESLDSLQQELDLISANVYDRVQATIQCSAETTTHGFTSGLLVHVDSTLDSEYPEKNRNLKSTGSRAQSPKSGIADIVILQDLNLASYDVQIEALELIRTRRIQLSTGSITAPEGFCIVVLQSATGPQLNKHLKDHIFLSHYHDLEDGFPNLESASEWIDDAESSSSSIVHKSVIQKPENIIDRTFSNQDIDQLRQSSQNVKVTAEIKCYLQNIVTFLRVHRAVDGGITPRATKSFDTLITCLAALHGLEYVTPALVAIAARKIYGHRIILTVPERERSLQYGSDLAAVRAVLEGVTPESIIEEVLPAVEAPM